MDDCKCKTCGHDHHCKGECEQCANDVCYQCDCDCCKD